MTTPDLTTTTGIAAAIKSAEGQKALMAVCERFGLLEGQYVYGDGYAAQYTRAQSELASLARTALPCALAELARVQAIVDRLPKTADGGPITLGINLWVKGMLLSEGVGVLAITDPDTSHSDDYPPGERWLITVRDGQGDEMTVWNGKCYSSQTGGE